MNFTDRLKPSNCTIYRSQTDHLSLYSEEQTKSQSLQISINTDEIS